MAELYDLAVVGLGYAGLPLAVAGSRNGLRVAGFDVNTQRSAGLADGRSHVDDISDDDIADALARGFRPTSDPDVLAGAETVVICVPTPLQQGAPDLSAVLQAAHTVAPRLRPGALVVLESTTYPGTTTEVLLPILEAGGRTVGSDFLLAYSPERIDPGNQDYGLHNTPKVVGGVTRACAAAATALYERMVQKVVEVSTPEAAELTKLLENTYRQVNIALVNEIARYCHGLGVDVWEVVAAAGTKPFGFQSFRPGPGVGGHCTPVDPGYLAYSGRRIGHPLRLPELAQGVNDQMPDWVVERIAALLRERDRPLRGAGVLLLGATYKADVADGRGSPAVPVAEGLLGLGARVAYHDPYLSTLQVGASTLVCEASVEAAVADADLVVLLQPHLAYDLAVLADKARLLFDTSGRVVGRNVVQL